MNLISHNNDYMCFCPKSPPRTSQKYFDKLEQHYELYRTRKVNSVEYGPSYTTC